MQFFKNNALYEKSLSTIRNIALRPHSIAANFFSNKNILDSLIFSWLLV